MKHLKGLIIVTLILVIGTAFYYQYANKEEEQKGEEQVQDELSEVEKILTKNLDEIYPSSPLDVVRYFTRIQKCYYNEDNTDAIVEDLADMSRKLFDEELLKVNPEEQYYEDLKQEIKKYKKEKIKITNITYTKSNDVMYSTVNGEQTASLNCTYYMQKGKHYIVNKERYLLRKDAEGFWKIYGWELDEPSEWEE